jgi:hypothetical protein
MENPLWDGGLIDFFFSSFFHSQVWKVCVFMQIFHMKFHSLPVWIHTGIHMENIRSVTTNKKNIFANRRCPSLLFWPLMNKIKWMDGDVFKISKNIFF